MKRVISCQAIPNIKESITEMTTLTDSRKRRLTFIIFTIPALFCCLLLIFVKFIVFPRVVAELLKLRQYEDGSLSLITRHWSSYPADMLYKLYMWNITNPDEFKIGNLIYVLGGMEEESWRMYTINTDTFAVKEVPTNSDVFGDNYYHREAVFVHQGTAYMWQGMDMIAGKEENGTFNWRRIETAGPKPRFYVMTSVGFLEGENPKYVVLVQDSYSLSQEEFDEGAGVEDDNFYKCELDLDTMVWTRTETIKEATGSLYDLTKHRFLATRDRFHMICDYSSIGHGEHHVLDRVTDEWTLLRNTWGIGRDPKCTAFVARDSVYKMGCVEKGDGYVMVVSRWIEGDVWEKVAEWPSRECNLSAPRTKVIVEGSRIFVICHYSRSSVDKDRLDHVLVFDLDPSLYDHSIVAVLRNESLKEVAVQELNLGSLLSRDASGDSLVPNLEPVMTDAELYSTFNALVASMDASTLAGILDEI